MPTPRAHLIGMAVAALFASSGASAYGDFNARMDCLGKIVYWGSAYSNPQDVRVNETSHNSFNVTGKVNDKSGRSQNFECRIEHKEVVNWNVHSEHSHDKDHKSNKAVLVGAGVVGLAVLAAVIASKNSDDPAHDDSRTTYNSGKGDPFDDMRYLKGECRRVIRQHLREDHGPVEDIDLESTHLNGRALTGDGQVTFESGGRRNLNYTCNFDRGGNVYDGHYNYQGR